MAFLAAQPLQPAQAPSRPYISRRRPRRLAQAASYNVPYSGHPYYDDPVPQGSTNGTSHTDTSSPSDVPINAQTRPVPTADQKSDLFLIAVPLNRGLIATPAQRDAVLQVIRGLELSSPPVAPADDARLLTGRWKLLYTDALDVLSLGLLAPVAVVGDVFQNIFEKPVDVRKDYEYDIVNIVKLQPAFAPVANSFLGETVAEIKVSAEGRRVTASRIDITFVRSAFKQEKVIGIDVPLELPPLAIDFLSPVGYIETTYLDEELRIARAPSNTDRKDGSVFVLVKDV